MPITLNGSTPEANLRTIVERAREHQSGTLYVGGDQVSHRTALGRVFKSAPLNPRTSIDNFKNLLAQTYPGLQPHIEALLAGDYQKGRLTTGTVDRVFRQLETAVAQSANQAGGQDAPRPVADVLPQPSVQSTIDAHKYRIAYHDGVQGRADRLRFEDQRALEVLQDPQTMQTVSDCALKLADHIEQSAAFTDAHARAFLKAHLQRGSLYPVHPEARTIPRNKAGLVEFLRTTANGNAPDRQVLLLSMMWMLPKKVGEAEGLREVKTIDRLYATKVYEGKQHVDLRQHMITLHEIGEGVAQALEADAGFSDQNASALVQKHVAAQAAHLSRPDAVGLPATKTELIALLRQPVHPQERSGSTDSDSFSLELIK